jgi:hypothetical protein
VNRRRLPLALLGGCILLAAAWLVWPEGEPPQTERLKDGSFVTTVAVTYGKKHAASVGTLRERLVGKLPAGLFPKWPRALSLRTNTERDTLVVWLYCTNSLVFNHYYVAGFVAGSNNVEFQTTRILAQGRGFGKGILVGMAVDAFPRQEETFTLRLRSLMSQRDSAEDYPVVAGLTVRNPRRSHADPWHAPPLPQRMVTTEFECELERCQVNVSKGLGTPLSMKWNFHEKAVPEGAWRVKKVELEDSAGNFLTERGELATPGETMGSLQIACSRSLLPGVGAWKVRAYVIRTGGFPSNEIWEVRDIPLINQPGYGQEVWQTNMSGALLELGSSSTLKRGSRSYKLGSLAGSMNGAASWVLLSSDSQDVMDRTSLLALVDNRGRAGAGKGGFHGEFFAGWAQEWDAGATSATIRLGVSHWRVVEFLVEPTVVGGKP